MVLLRCSKLGHALLAVRVVLAAVSTPSLGRCCMARCRRGLDAGQQVALYGVVQRAHGSDR